VQKISSSLGESRDKTQAGIHAAVPGILSGFETVSGTPDGMQRFSTAVDGADDGMMSRIGGMFGMGSSSESGLFNLRSILGGNAVSDLSGNIGRSSGLASKSVMTLLGFLTPVVLGVLKNLKLTKGLDSMGLRSLLSSQRGNFAEAMPVAETYRVPETEVRARPATETYAVRETERPRSSGLGWVVPLLLLVGLAALLWRWNSSRSPVHAGNETVAERPGESAYKAPGTSASFDSLKTKYQSVFDVAKAQGVDITNSNFENGKLDLKGTAPSSEAANRVWDEIKRINPSMDDINANIAVNTSSNSIPSHEGFIPGQTAENANPNPNPKAVPETEQAPLEKPSAPPSASDTTKAENVPAPESNMNEPKAGAEPETAPMDRPSSSDAAKAGNAQQVPDNNLKENQKAAKPETAPIEKPSSTDKASGAASATEGQTYTVKRGDTLFKISQQFYGNGKGFQRIFDANSDKLKDVNKLEVGQELTIPGK